MFDLALLKSSGDAEEALVKAKQSFNKLTNTNQVKLNNHLVTLVQAVETKLLKDKAFLEELARSGVTASDVLPRTNVRIG